MATVRRLFFCRRCGSRGALDRLCTQLIQVICAPCDVAEAWSPEDMRRPLDHFHFLDEPHEGRPILLN